MVFADSSFLNCNELDRLARFKGELQVRPDQTRLMSLKTTTVYRRIAGDQNLENEIRAICRRRRFGIENPDAVTTDGLRTLAFRRNS